jgi:protein-tyrosine phosphatase
LEAHLVKVLFVCSGNICRSPIAQGVFEDLVRREGLEGEIFTDSAGTTSFHVGSGPDRRARQAASSRGIALDSQTARRITPADLQEFDYVLVMDRGNYEDVLHLAARPEASAYLGMFLDYALDLPDSEVPDPYYGAGDGFERAMDLAEAASVGLLEDIKRRYLGDGFV